MIPKTWVTLGLCFTFAIPALAQTRAPAGSGNFGGVASGGGG